MKSWYPQWLEKPEFQLLNTLKLINIEIIIDGTGFEDMEATAEIQALAKKENTRFVFLKYVIGAK